MDAFGHVNNVVFLRYLEEARIDFMFRLAPGTERRRSRGGSVVARHEIDYMRPLVHRHDAGDHRALGDRDRRGVASRSPTRSRTTTRSTCGPRRSSCRTTSTRAAAAPDHGARRRRLPARSTGTTTRRRPSPHDGAAWHLADAGEAADLAAFLGRLIHYDRAAAVRLQARRRTALAVFGRPPSFEVLAIRTARLAKPYEHGPDAAST